MKKLLPLPTNSNPNAIRELICMSGKSVPQICKEIKEATGVRLIDKAVLRAAYGKPGLGREKWKILADYFGVETWQLHDPTFPKKLKENPPEWVVA